MNLYADTSALIKKYIREAGSEQIIAHFNQYPIICTAALTQAEMASAMSKAVRLGWVNEPEILIAWQDFLTHWPAFVRLPVSAGVIERASSLAWHHGLRAYDSVHLASALAWKDVTGDQVVFACCDRTLLKAARQEGLQIWPEGAEE
ncbi:MAG: type II toxin-antitoxin system VapC family toxin [Anaerolineales bacterium]|jgi:predicted nucleic acid-binding protein